MNQLINDGGDCRTAHATPGLLEITSGHGKYVQGNAQHNTFIRYKVFIVKGNEMNYSQLFVDQSSKV